MTDTFIRAVAAEVRGHDSKYEETLREREKANAKYNFLLRRDVRFISTFSMTLLSHCVVAPKACILSRSNRVIGALQASIR